MTYGRWTPREDVRPKVKRFDYMDRLAQAEEDEEDTVEQRIAAWQANLKPVKPDRVLQVEGTRVAVYTGEGQLELRRRAAQLAKLREGKDLR